MAYYYAWGVYVGTCIGILLLLWYLMRGLPTIVRRLLWLLTVAVLLPVVSLEPDGQWLVPASGVVVLEMVSMQFDRSRLAVLRILACVLVAILLTLSWSLWRWWRQRGRPTDPFDRQRRRLRRRLS